MARTDAPGVKFTSSTSAKIHLIHPCGFQHRLKKSLRAINHHLPTTYDIISSYMIEHDDNDITDDIPDDDDDVFMTITFYSLNM